MEEPLEKRIPAALYDRSGSTASRSGSDPLQAQQPNNIGTWQFNFTTKKLTWSDELFAIAEVDRSFELQYKAVLSLLDTSSKARLIRRIFHLFKTQVSFDITLCFFPLRQQQKWIRLIGKPEVREGGASGACGIAIDVTNEHNLQEMLRASEEKFRKAFRNNPDSVAIIREEDLLITEVNSKAFLLLGYRPEEMIGRRTTDIGFFVRKEDRERFFHKYYSGGVAEMECLWKKKNGEPVLVLFTCSRIRIGHTNYFLSHVKEVFPGSGRKQSSAVKMPSELKKLMRDLEYRQDDPASRLALPTSEGMIFVRMRDIIYCEAESNYTRFHLVGGKKIIVSRTLKEFEKILPGRFFIRIHHSCILNINFIERYNKADGSMVMENNALLYVSRRKKEEVHARLGINRFHSKARTGSLSEALHE